MDITRTLHKLRKWVNCRHILFASSSLSWPNYWLMLMLFSVCMCVCRFETFTQVFIFMCKMRNHLQLFIISVYLVESMCTSTKRTLYGLHNLCRWKFKIKTNTHVASLLFPARLQFHLFQQFHALRVVSIIFHTFYFDYYSYFICRIVFSHGTGSLSFVLFSHVVLLSFRIHWKGRMFMCASVWMFTHAFRATWYWISRIYLFLYFHLSAFFLTYLC